MTTTIKHATYKSWSGGVARGGPLFKDPVDPKRHADRAVWLAGQLEAASFGTVQNYDGCAMSGGILHNIAVSPKDNTQGSFFALLRRVIDLDHAAVTAKMQAEFTALGWTITEDGVLRFKASGNAVPGVTIRNVFSPPNGHVPSSGPQWDRAVYWLTIFNELLSSPSTVNAQSSYAISWLAAGAALDENVVYRHYVDPHLDTWIGLWADANHGVLGQQMDPYFELAMCVYHAFSVNAPGEARKRLVDAYGNYTVDGTPSVRHFSKSLVKALGTSNYGAWHDNIENRGNRYDRTRIAVWSRPELWPTPMAHEVMPENLT